MDLKSRRWEGAEVGARYHAQSPEALMIGEPKSVMDAFDPVWVGAGRTGQT